VEDAIVLSVVNSFSNQSTHYPLKGLKAMCFHYCQPRSRPQIGTHHFQITTKNIGIIHSLSTGITRFLIDKDSPAVEAFMRTLTDVSGAAYTATLGAGSSWQHLTFFKSIQMGLSELDRRHGNLY